MSRRAVRRGRSPRWETIAAFSFGVIFVVILLSLALFVARPTPFQYTVFRIILALACAGVAAVIPGILQLQFGQVLGAGGALAVFVLVYFYSPAALVSEPEPRVDADLTLYDGHYDIRGDPTAQVAVTTGSPNPAGRVTYVPERWDRQELTVNYEYEPVDKRTARVQTVLPYTKQFMGGGPIGSMDPDIYQEISAIRVISWEWPRLSLQIVNNTPRTIQINTVAIRVISSEVDTEPLLIIQGGYNGFTLVNQGWGDALGTTLQFGILNEAECEGRPWEAPTIGQLELGDVGEFAHVDLKGFIPPALVPPGDQELEDRQEAYACVGGLISFQNEGRQSRRVTFYAKIQISGPVAASSLALPEEEYYVFLPAGRAGYTKYVPMAHEVQPGRAEHLLLRFGTDKSAAFELQFQLQGLEELEVPIKTLFLSLILPRLDATTLSDSYRK
jgi:hypothetical protein